MQSKRRKKPFHVVTIGGGSGQYALLSGLRDIADIRISAVVSMMDSGGSTGRLRDELGTLPPGDILKCILALSPHQETARAIFQKRFNKDRRLKGHNAGNMLLTMLSRYTGSFPAGVQALAEILDARGEILPVTIDRATLVAELTDGSRVFGESAIDTPRGHQRETIRDVYLVPHHSDTITVFPPVLEAIADADYIILGPGDLFTSIIPNLIVPGLKEKLKAVSAPIYYVVNIMTKFGETNHFQACDFIATWRGLPDGKSAVPSSTTDGPMTVCSAFIANKNRILWRLDCRIPDARWSSKTFWKARVTLSATTLKSWPACLPESFSAIDGAGENACKKGLFGGSDPPSKDCPGDGQIFRCRDLDIHPVAGHHGYGLSGKLGDGRIIGGNESALDRQLVGRPDQSDGKSLRRLGQHDLPSVQRFEDYPVFVHPLQGIRCRNGGDTRAGCPDPCEACIQERQPNKGPHPVVNHDDAIGSVHGCQPV
jgi:uncharacterized cofD-like protein